MALPFGAAPEEHPQAGNVESAPARPRLLLKALVTTVLAALGDLGHRLVHRAAGSSTAAAAAEHGVGADCASVPGLP